MTKIIIVTKKTRKILIKRALIIAGSIIGVAMARRILFSNKSH